MYGEDKEESKLKSERDRIQRWLKDIATASKREKTFRKKAMDAEKIYESEDAAEDKFNILYANTETLLPALYNSTPRPTVQRRYKDEDEAAKSSALVAQRMLEFQLDSDNRDYATFDSLIASAVLAALVPGRGVVRFKYEADIAANAEGVETVSKEYVCGEEVGWKNFTHGYGRKWEDVPWIAYEHFMSKTQLEENFGAEIAAKVELVTVSDTDEEGEKTGADKETKGVDLGHVWEIWDKLTKTVIFISPGSPDIVLKEVPDPLELSGFFPQPKPLQFFNRLRSLTPVPLYTFYETQAKELNKITTRINVIIGALKVRGMYDSTIEGLEKVFEANDNEMVPAQNVAAMQQGQTLEKGLMFVPLEGLVGVLQQLYAQRAQVKQVIYELTGIADIMRGSSVASETLGAQELKNQWGTLRLKRAQKEVQRFVRDCLRIMVELSATKFSESTVKAMTNVPYPLAAEKQQATAVLQLMQQQAASVVGQEPPQMPEEITTMASMPAVEELLTLLRDDLQRSYKIDIETNSTVDAEATEDKQDMSELMNAIAQFLNGAAPAVEQGLMPFEAAKAMLLGIVRKFRFGSDVEDLIKTMKAPPPKEPEKPAGDPPEVVAAKAQSALAMERSKQETMQLEGELAKADHAFKMRELAMKQQMLERKAQLDEATHRHKMEQALLPKPAPAPAKGK